MGWRRVGDAIQKMVTVTQQPFLLTLLLGKTGGNGLMLFLHEANSACLLPACLLEKLFQIGGVMLPRVKQF